MKSLIYVVFFLAAAAGAANAQGANAELRGELLAMVKVDQDARTKCAVGTAEEQARCLMDVATAIDTPHTKRLEEIFEKHGFPSRSLVGTDGQKAFMLLLQHAPTEGLRTRAVESVKKAFERKELEPQEYANFIDRHLLRQGKPQLYGSGFETKNGKLVLSPTEDPQNLDTRRRSIGLPPMSEYTKLLKEFYKLEVVLENN